MKTCKRPHTVVLEAQRSNIVIAGFPCQRTGCYKPKVLRKGCRNFTHSWGTDRTGSTRRPCISSQSKQVLETGMVFTIEPAIYLPNKCGIRIEDMVLVTKKGCEVISGSLNK